jgi:hypothetical protein
MAEKKKSFEDIYRELLAKAQEFYDVTRQEGRRLGITILIENKDEASIALRLDPEIRRFLHPEVFTSPQGK